MIVVENEFVLYRYHKLANNCFNLEQEIVRHSTKRILVVYMSK